MKMFVCVVVVGVFLAAVSTQTADSFSADQLITDSSCPHVSTCCKHVPSLIAPEKLWTLVQVQADHILMSIFFR